MKKLLPLLLAILLAGCGASNDEKHTKSVFAMDTYITLTSYGGTDKALEAASDKLTELESLWSVTDSGSEIYKANHSGGSTVTFSDETAELVCFALDMYKKTDGALDISIYPLLAEWGFTTSDYHVPSQDRIDSLLKAVDAKRVDISGNSITVPNGMMIDLGSVAKGRAADLAADVLKDKGITSALLDLGGNIRTIGTKPDGSLWKIGLRDPNREGTLGTVTVGETSVVTSGGYERFFIEDGKTYWHILDPKTGYPADSGIISSTVIGNDGALCDALSTSLFILGADKAAELYKTIGGFEYILLNNDGELLVSAGIADSFSLSQGRNDLKVTVVK
ncbi:MAG: FAD:protein FMN transferase [Ruminococcus sp.]|nr:FAD:protein FMN transferase [Ruminococcus sp.]